MLFINQGKSKGQIIYNVEKLCSVINYLIGNTENIHKNKYKSLADIKNNSHNYKC